MDPNSLLNMKPDTVRKLLGNAERDNQRPPDALLTSLRDAFEKHDYQQLLGEVKLTDLALRTAPMRHRV